MANLLALPIGTELVREYRIERVLGAGGFGITYLAEEVTLARKVTIKEYFPSDFAARTDGTKACPRSRDSKADYDWGLERFLDEAQTLARFDHPNIVRVYRYFRANATGYMVLHYEDGRSLKAWLKSLRRAPRQAELDGIVSPLLDALEVVHATDFLHRDIAPDNIIIRPDGSPVLIDFGSARSEIAQHSRTVSALVKPGYSAYEQYAETSSQQGAWSDIYALGATLYQAISGKRPPDAPSRMVADQLRPAHEVALSSYRPEFLAAIDRALALPIEARPQSVKAWRSALLPGPDAANSQGTGGKAEAASDRSTHAPSSAGFDRAAATPRSRRGLLRRLRTTDEATPNDTSPAAATPAGRVGDGAEARVRDGSPRRRGKGWWRREPRPRPVRDQSRRKLGRSLAIRLALGCALAAALVGLQNRLPLFDGRGSGIVTGSIARSPFLERFEAHRGGARFVAFAKGGDWIATAGSDATLKIWADRHGRLIRTISLVDGPATAVAATGKRALTGHANGAVAVWNLETGESIARVQRNSAEVWSVAFVKGEDVFATSGHDWAVTLWNVGRPQTPLYVFEGHENAVQAVAAGQGGQLLASGGADKVVRLWNTSTLELLRTYKGHRDFITAVAFDPQARYVAAASLDGSVRIWSTRSSRLVKVLRGHRGKIASLSFSPDGTRLVTAGDDSAVRVWSVEQGKVELALPGHDGAVNAAIFSPDGRRIVSGGSDGTIRLWLAHVVQPGS